MNLFVGRNGSGKTSFLEAIYFLGRGRSFRAADNRTLIQRGKPSAELLGVIPGPAGSTKLGIRISHSGTELQIPTMDQAGLGDLARLLPIQAIHADIGALIQGGPELRRRMLDWGVFHVEHRFLRQWREYRRTLMQRNSALRAGASELIDVWDERLGETGTEIDAFRRQYLKELTPVFQELAAELLGAAAELEYRPGWDADQSLSVALGGARDSDQELGYTRLGPHRADLHVRLGELGSRWHASRGQQKLLASALVLALCRVAGLHDAKPVALVVDEPAADLDADRLRTFLRCVLDTPAQIFMASISADGLTLEATKSMFHVEHGAAKALL